MEVLFLTAVIGTIWWLSKMTIDDRKITLSKIMKVGIWILFILCCLLFVMFGLGSFANLINYGTAEIDAYFAYITIALLSFMTARWLWKKKLKKTI